MKERVLRLLAPSWAFLIIYFILAYLFCFIVGELYPYSITGMLLEFLFRSKIIGLWIIRVFIFVALVAPFFYMIYKRRKSNLAFIVMLFIIYLAYEIIYYITSHHITGLPLKILENSLFEMIPYVCIFCLGMTLVSTDKSFILITMISFCVIFIIFFSLYSYLGVNLSTQEYKFPPRIYYLSYAIAVSLFLYLLFDSIKINNPFILNVIYFISSSSLWIYLWSFFAGTYLIQITPSFLQDIAVLHYITVLLISILITYIQKNVISKIIESEFTSARSGKLLSLIFLK